MRPKSTWVFLSATALVSALAAPAPAFTGHAPTHKASGGISLHLAVAPGEVAAPAHPPDISWGRHDQHVMVAIFDAASGDRIKDAKVEAHVAPLGLGGAARPLNPRMFAGALTYCNRFTMREDGIYRIRVSISRAGKTRPVRMMFVHHHQNR